MGLLDVPAVTLQIKLEKLVFKFLQFLNKFVF